MNPRKAIDDLCDSLRTLEDQIVLFNAGRTHSCRPAAVELRKLLCDGNNSLLPRVWGRIRLHPLLEMPSGPPDDAVVFQVPGITRFDGAGGHRVEVLFDERRPLMDLPDWLAQPLMSATITVRELIRSVADKEGAHSDRDYNATLEVGHAFHFVDVAAHKSLIIAMAEYLVRVIRPAVAKIETRRRDEAQKSASEAGSGKL